MAGRRAPSFPTKTRLPSWRIAPPRSGRVRPANASGCWNTHPCSPPARALTRRSCSTLPAFPVFEAGRGGRYTYHGPGQRVGYVMLDLDRRGRDVRRLVHSLEGWVISTLAELGVSAHRADGRIGIWVGEGSSEAKIAALGIRIKRWVTLHGFAINVSPDLSHFGASSPADQRVRRDQPSGAWERNAGDAR